MFQLRYANPKKTAETPRQSVQTILKSQTWPDRCPFLQNAVALKLFNAGFKVTCEFPTFAFGDTRNGRVNLVCEKNNEFTAIEFDRSKPRRRSVAKLRLLPVHRIVTISDKSSFENKIEGIEILKLKLSEDINRSHTKKSIGYSSEFRQFMLSRLRKIK